MGDLQAEFLWKKKRGCNVESVALDQGPEGQRMGEGRFGRCGYKGDRGRAFDALLNSGHDFMAHPSNEALWDPSVFCDGFHGTRLSPSDVEGQAVTEHVHGRLVLVPALLVPPLEQVGHDLGGCGVQLRGNFPFRPVVVHGLSTLALFGHRLARFDRPWQSIAFTQLALEYARQWEQHTDIVNGVCDLSWAEWAGRPVGQGRTFGQVKIKASLDQGSQPCWVAMTEQSRSDLHIEDIRGCRLNLAPQDREILLATVDDDCR